MDLYLSRVYPMKKVEGIGYVQLKERAIKGKYSNSGHITAQIKHFTSCVGLADHSKN